MHLKLVLISLILLTGCSTHQPTRYATEEKLPETVTVDSKRLEEEVRYNSMYGTTMVKPEEYFLFFASGQYDTSVKVSKEIFDRIQDGDEILVSETVITDEEGRVVKVRFKYVGK